MQWCGVKTGASPPPKLAWSSSLKGSLKRRGPTLSRPSRVSDLCSPFSWGGLLKPWGTLCKHLRSRPSTAVTARQSLVPSGDTHSCTRLALRWQVTAPEWVVQEWEVVKQGIKGRPDRTEFRLIYCHLTCLWGRFTQRAFSLGWNNIPSKIAKHEMRRNHNRLNLLHALVFYVQKPVVRSL